MTKKRPEKILLRVTKGALIPADELAQQRLRDKGYKTGDILAATLRKPRNPGYHRFVHAFGQLLVENIDEFTSMNAHTVLKRLQWECGVGCDEMGAKLPGVGYVQIRIPQSLSFESMAEGEFREVFGGLCNHVAEHYWTDLSADEIEGMVEMMENAA